ncbi:MAG: trehalose-6-phosphate synthase [Candidatus Obscuribacterales bacterium]|nr:trehalose-6-phosphate synthase [Candidatus Obscuribacterales bacterium]
MNIVSYRGPGMAGGLSNAMTKVWEKDENNGNWWFVSDNALSVSRGKDSKSETLAVVDQDIINGHYRYCNDFLWPVMHDLSAYATYRMEDRKHYKAFNRLFAPAIIKTSANELQQGCFIHDYQLAGMPMLLKQDGHAVSALFWHIPWPKKVEEHHVLAIVDIVRPMLYADIIGFHTQEYVDNFVAFVEQNVPDYKGDLRKKVVAAPLGINYNLWSSLADKQEKEFLQVLIGKTPMVLSVDRSDFTKGVSNRMQAIDLFFRMHPQWKEKVRFLQVCGRTRAGIDVFDKYWVECRQLSRCVNNEWQTEDWRPITWLDQPLNSGELSMLYRNANVMLVNPLRDGLNLTAKEYIACQKDEPGVLALSSGAGAWAELADGCVPVDPRQPGQMADAMNTALNISKVERDMRMQLLTKAIRGNTLDNWWQKFTLLLADKATAAHKYSSGKSYYAELAG